MAIHVLHFGGIGVLDHDGETLRRDGIAVADTFDLDGNLRDGELPKRRLIA